MKHAKVLILGSGPAGLAAAQQLARAGHDVTVFEKNGHVGGLLRRGIPDFKLDKETVRRRVAQMEAEGVTFKTKVVVGDNVRIQNNVSVYDSVTLEDDVFVGPSAVFTNVNNPRSAFPRKNEYRDTVVKKGA